MLTKWFTYVFQETELVQIDKRYNRVHLANIPFNLFYNKEKSFSDSMPFHSEMVPRKCKSHKIVEAAEHG